MRPNTGDGSTQIVNVLASDQTRIVSIAGALGGSGFGIGAWRWT